MMLLLLPFSITACHKRKTILKPLSLSPSLLLPLPVSLCEIEGGWEQLDSCCETSRASMEWSKLSFVPPSRKSSRMLLSVIELPLSSSPTTSISSLSLSLSKCVRSANLWQYLLSSLVASPLSSSLRHPSIVRLSVSTHLRSRCLLIRFLPIVDPAQIWDRRSEGEKETSTMKTEVGMMDSVTSLGGTRSFPLSTPSFNSIYPKWRMCHWRLCTASW